MSTPSQSKSAQIQKYLDLLKNPEKSPKKKRALARLITFIENGGPEAAKTIIPQIYPLTGKAHIIGITGAPGSGKSTLTSEISNHFLEKGLTVSVIAVDPTSPFTGGAILGDRIRMKKNFTNPNFFIRSMANRGQLGGLAMATKDVIHIIDAYGSDIIIVETVGVGQSEIDIFKSAHTTLVITPPGLGDEIQAIKAGLMEITDIFVVNKMDRDGADKRVAELETMLDFADNIDITNNYTQAKVVRCDGWRPPVIKTNGLTGENVPVLLENIQQHLKFLEESGYKKLRLQFRYKHYIIEILKYFLVKNVEEIVFSNDKINEFIEKLLSYEKGSDPYTISEAILEVFLNRYFS
ncbi:MAG: methylmalonyl Co-A mutase-associated GTPase MeaB [Promethearchaeota archaeon]